MAAAVLGLPAVAQVPTLLHRSTGTQSQQFHGFVVNRLQDIDGDGREEFAVNAPGGPQIWSGLSIASILSTPYGLYGLCDIDADGREEIVTRESLYPPGTATDVGSFRLYSRTATLRYFAGTLGGPSPGDELYFNDAKGRMGDVDGDGVDDYSAKIALAFQYLAPIVSGKTGAVIRPAYAYGRCLPIGDVDDDGFDEILLAANLCYYVAPNIICPGWIGLENGRTGVLMWSHWGEHDDCALGDTLIGVDDIDDDGAPDVVANAPNYKIGLNSVGYARAYSGATGAVLWSRTGSWPYGRVALHLAAGADWTGDGVPDAAMIRAGLVPYIGGVTSTALVDILDGTNGNTVATLPHQPFVGFQPPEGFFKVHLGGDVDLDGSVELITHSIHPATEPAFNAGTMAIWKLAGSAAYRRYRGVACQGSNGKHPRITLRNPPHLGWNAEFRLRAALPTTPAVLSFGISASLPLGTTPCMTHAVGELFAPPILTNADGYGRLTIQLPADPGLTGLHLCAFWYAFDPAANALGLTTSNACEMVLGP